MKKLSIATAAWRLPLAAIFSIALSAGCARSGEDRDGAAPQSSAEATMAEAPSAPARCGDADDACRARWEELDHFLPLYEAGVFAVIGDQAQSCFQSDIESWRAALSQECSGDAACEERRYRERLGSLVGMQPGANANDDHARDDVPVLIAVLGPEFESVDQGGEPYEATGRLIHAGLDLSGGEGGADHMGYAIDDGAATPHVIVLDADIGNQPGHEAIGMAIEQQQAGQFLAKGKKFIAADGGADFDSGACRFVYRAPAR